MKHVFVVDVIRAVAAQSGLTIGDLQSQARPRAIAWPRQRAMYVAHKVTGRPLSIISRQFGDRHHTTVMHGCRRVAERIAVDPTERALVDDLLSRFSGSLADTIALVQAETEGLRA